MDANKSKAFHLSICVYLRAFAANHLTRECQRAAILVAVFSILGCFCATLLPVSDCPATDIQDATRSKQDHEFGILGLPLGEVCTMRGYWMFDRPEDWKHRQLVFLVTHVNGKELNDPCRFSEVTQSENSKLSSFTGKLIEPTDPDEGDVWEMRGWEAGGFRGIPRVALDETNKLRTEAEADLARQGVHIPFRSGKVDWRFRFEPVFMFFQQRTIGNTKSTTGGVLHNQ